MRLLPYILLCALLLCACGARGAHVTPIVRPSYSPQYVENQLICSAETEQEARRIAELYGISLLSFDYSVALFETEEDLDAVIARGEENNWPPLQRNYISDIH